MQSTPLNSKDDKADAKPAWVTPVAEVFDVEDVTKGSDGAGGEITFDHS